MQAHQLQERGGEVEPVEVDRRDRAVPVGEPDRGHPETQVAAETHALDLAAAAVGPVQVGGAGQPHVRLFGGDLGEHRLDALGCDGHQRRLHVAEQRGLVLVGADDQGHRVRHPPPCGGDRVVRDHVAVDDRGEREKARRVDRHLVEHRAGRLHDSLGRQLVQAVEVARSEVEHLEEACGHPPGAFGVIGGRRRGALRDRRAEQAGCRGAAQQRGDHPAAGGLTEQRHLGRVPAEGGDVVADPLQGGEHVAQTEVGGEAFAVGAQGGQFQEAECAEPVVDGHDDHVAAGGQRGAVVERLTGRAQHVGSAVDPHHHRLAVAGLGVGGCPDIERQEIVALRCAEVDRDLGIGGLGAHRAHARRVGGFGPLLRRLGCAPPQFADGRGGVTHGLPGLDGAVVDPADRAVGGVDHRAAVGWATGGGFRSHPELLRSTVRQRAGCHSGT